MRTNIKNKLLIVLLVANGLLALGMYALATQRIDKGFVEYLEKTQDQKLAPFAAAIGRTYGEYGDWRWVHARSSTWRDLIESYVKDSSEGPRSEPPPRPPFGEMGMPPPPGEGFAPPPRPGERGDFGGPPPGRGPLNLDLRFLVRDAGKTLIIGQSDLVKEARWLPIRYNDRVVGELGVITVPGDTSTMNEVFIQEQKRVVGYMVLALLVSAVIISLVIARHFQKPLARMTKAVRKLVAGDYQQTLAVDSSDEFGQLGNDLNLLSRTLKESQESRRQWIADISHELRTPVAIIQGELHAMLDGVREMNKDAIVSLQQESQRLSNLVGDLHELSLSDLGALAYHKQPLDLGELLDQFIDDKQSAATDAGLMIDKQFLQQQVIAFADDERLEQLFKNLFQNTLRYTDMPGTLLVSLETVDREVVIRWEDSSPGISDEDIPRLFDRLYRVGKSRSRAKGGSGLGMSICKNIVDAHDGEISVYHSPGGGVGIKIVLPRMQE